MIKTKIHYYKFELPQDKQKYAELGQNARDLTGLKKPDIHHWINFDYSSKAYDSLKAFMEKIKNLKEVNIETEHLFNNQFNTKEGLRVFLWSEIEYKNKDIKEGYFIEMTEQLKTALNTTYKCGFCGKQYNKKQLFDNNGFCRDCLGSEYLKEDNLFLLRLKAISDTTERQPLTDVEKEYLLIDYRIMQNYHNNKRMTERGKKLYADIEKDYKKTTTTAKIEYKGKKWLLDNNIPFEFYNNCIYYSHTNKWCFGWRSKLNFEQEQKLKALLNGFPFEYEIKV